MKKPALKKPPKKDEIADIVSEIVEESKEEKKIEVAKKPDEAENQTPAEEEEVREVDIEPTDGETVEEVMRRSSFYEKVMGEKPPEKREEPEEAKKERSVNAKLFLLGAFVFVLTILISSLVGLSILNKDVLVSKLGQKATITPTQVPPTPTPIAFVRSDWSFEVLNGSNTPGLAAKGAEKVKALGYTVGKVGNADDSVDTAQIYFSKDANEAQKNAILSDLKNGFGEITIKDIIPGSEKTVRIILAK